MLTAPFDKSGSLPESALVHDSQTLKKLKFKLSSDSGKEVFIDVNPRAGMPSHFLFALHKSGSVLLNTMVQELACAAGEPYVDVPGDLFYKGIDLQGVQDGSGQDLFRAEGVCFGGFREWPHRVGLVIPARSRCVFLVRDPRDILVSLYFSIWKSHSLPDEGMLRGLFEEQRRFASEVDIDAYVLNEADHILQKITDYRNVFSEQRHAAVKIFRYEDVIFNKVEWMAEVADWFGWKIPHETIVDVALRNDIRPEQENPDQHVRKVVPGDHREKLKPETIEQLTHMFQEVMLSFGYDLKKRPRVSALQPALV